MSTKQTIKGFTIIEVVLVLAIAGLIFLMVFVALPSLQAGQRDTARKNDVGAVATAVSNYTANNRGAFPTTAQLTNYAKNISTNSTAPVVADYKATITVTEGQLKVVQKAKCVSTGTAENGIATQTLGAGTTNQFVVITFLESGGGTSFCQDS